MDFAGKYSTDKQERNAATERLKKLNVPTQSVTPLKNNGGFVGGMGYVGTQAAAGAVGVVEGIYDFTVGGIADLVGNEEYAKRLHDNDISGNMTKKATEKFNPSKGWEFAGNVASGIGQSATSALITAGLLAVTGGTASVVIPQLVAGGIMGFGAAGKSTTAAYQKTGELGGKEYLYGAASGILEGSLEGLTGVGGKVAGRMLRGTGETVAKSAVRKSIAKGVFSDASGEFVEESLSEFINPYLERGLKIDEDAENATLTEIIYAGMVGFVSGAVMGGGSTAINATSNVKRGTEIIEKGKTDTLLETANKLGEYVESAENVSLVAPRWRSMKGSVDAYNALADKTGLKGRMLLGEIQRGVASVEGLKFVQESLNNIKENAETVSKWYSEHDKYVSAEDIRTDKNGIATQIAVVEFAGKVILPTISADSYAKGLAKAEKEIAKTGKVSDKTSQMIVDAARQGQRLDAESAGYTLEEGDYTYKKDWKITPEDVKRLSPEIKYANARPADFVVSASSMAAKQSQSQVVMQGFNKGTLKKGTAAAIKDFASSKGITVIYYFDDSKGATRGYEKEGKIYLNTASNVSLGIIVVHEYMHYISTNNPKAYNELKKTILALVEADEGFKKLYNKTIKQYKSDKRTKGRSQEYYVEEGIARCLQELIVDFADMRSESTIKDSKTDKALNKVSFEVQHDKTLLEKIRDIFKAMRSWLQGAKIKESKTELQNAIAAVEKLIKEDVAIEDAANKGSSKKKGSNFSLKEYDEFMQGMSKAERELFDNISYDDFMDIIVENLEIEKQLESDSHQSNGVKKSKQTLRDEYVEKLYEIKKLNELVTKLVEKNPQMKEFFKDSKVNNKYNLIGGSDEYIVMFHGSESDFTKFDSKRIGKHGTVKGSGFYFIQSMEYAKNYSSEDGRVYAVLLNIKKPLSYSGHTMTRAELKRFIREVVDSDGTDYLSNYDDVNKVGYDKLLDSAVNRLFDSNTNDADLIEEVFVGSRMEYDKFFNGLTQSTGYDGVIMWNRSEGTTALAFRSNQIKDIFNFKPTDNEDIMYSLAEGHSDDAVYTADVETKYALNNETLSFLNNQKSVKVYRAMQMVDGKLYPPMAAKVGGKWASETKIGEWEESVERTDKLIKKENKNGEEVYYFALNKGNGSTIYARYNPYFHTSLTPLNDQFTSAYTRPNLVIVEGEVPSSELTSGYKADKAKDAVGETDWHSGVVSSKLKGEKARRVILSRWFKPVRVVSDGETAKVIAKLLEGEDITIPYQVVTPSLKAALEREGVSIDNSDIDEGDENKDIRYSLDSYSDAIKEFVSVAKATAADARKTKRWTGKELRDLYEQFPEADIIMQYHLVDSIVVEEWEKYLNTVDDISELDILLWYPVRARYADDWTRKHIKAINRYKKAINARITAILEQGGTGTNLGLKKIPYSFDEIRDLFYKLNSNPEVKTLADKVFAYAKEYGLSFYGRSGAYRETYTGLSVGRRITYKTEFMNSIAYSDQDKATVILHEIIHSGTTYALHLYNNEKSRIHLSKELQDACGALIAIRGQISLDSDFKGMYGTKNEYEMVAELANPDFRAKLQQKSLWQSIVDLIKKIFGINKGDALSGAEAALEQILEYRNVMAQDIYFKIGDKQGYKREGNVDDADNRLFITANSADAKYSLNYSEKIASEQKKLFDDIVSGKAKYRAGINAEELAKAHKLIEDTKKMIDAMPNKSGLFPSEVLGKVISDNLSYGVSVDGTRICFRTLTANDFIDRVQEIVGKPLTAEEALIANEKLIVIAKEPQCLICYVALDRKAYWDYALWYIKTRDEYISKWNKTDKSNEAFKKLYSAFLKERPTPIQDKYAKKVSNARGTGDSFIDIIKLFLAEKMTNQDEKWQKKIRKEWDASQKTESDAEKFLASYTNAHLMYTKSRADTDVMEKRLRSWFAWADSGARLIGESDLTTQDKIENLYNETVAFTDKNATDKKGRALLKAASKGRDAYKYSDLATQYFDLNNYAQSASWAKKANMGDQVMSTEEKTFGKLLVSIDDSLAQYTTVLSYYNDIRNLSTATVELLNHEYGLRFYSYSEFNAAFMVDNMQEFIDAALVGLKVLMYSKSYEAALLFAPTGANINLGVILREDGNGGYTIFEEQSTPTSFENLVAIRKKYKNVGIVAVATTRKMAIWAAKQDWIDIVIPFHTVRNTNGTTTYAWEDFKYEQEDKLNKGKGKTLDMWNKWVKLVQEQTGSIKQPKVNIMPFEHNNDFETYIRLCAERDINPRFKSLMPASSGLTPQQYMKFVNETRQSANDTPVVSTNFDAKMIGQILENFDKTGGYKPQYNVSDGEVDVHAQEVARDILSGKFATEVEYGSEQSKGVARQILRGEISSSNVPAMHNAKPSLSEDEYLYVLDQDVEYFDNQTLSALEQQQEEYAAWLSRTYKYSSVQLKKYTKKDMDSIISGALSMMYSDDVAVELKGKSRTQVIQHFYDKFNSVTGDKQAAVARQLADYLIDHSEARSVYSMLEEQYRLLSVLKTFRKKVKMIDELKVATDYAGLNRQIYNMWAAPKGVKGQNIEDVVTELEGYGVFIDSMTASDMLLQINELYQRTKAEIASAKSVAFSGVISPDERTELRNNLAQQIRDGFIEKGKDTYVGKLIQMKDKTILDLKKELRLERHGNKIANQLIHEVTGFKDLVKGNYVNAGDLRNKDLEKAVKLLQGLTTRGYINQHGRKYVLALAKWYSKDNQLLYSAVNGAEEYNYLDESALDAFALLEQNATSTKPMDTTELAAALHIVRAVKHLLKTYDQVIIEGKRQSVTEIAAPEFYRMAKKNLLGKSESWWSNICRKVGSTVRYIEDPKAVFSHFDEGYDGLYTRLYKAAVEGETRARYLTLDMLKPFNEFEKANGKYSKRLTKRKVKLGEETVPMDVAISLYLTYKREHARDRLLKSTEGWEYISEQGNVIPAGAMDLSFIDTIEAQLTAEDKEYIRLVEKFFNADAKKLLVETDSERLGYSRPMEGYYYPIARSEGTIARDLTIDSDAMTYANAVANLSFTKSTVQNARGRLRIRSVIDVVNTHAVQMGRYAGLWNVVDTYNKVLNKRDETGTNLKTLLDSKVWKNSSKYIKDLMADLQGVKGPSRTGDKTVRWLRGQYAKYQLGFNLKTVLSQTAALPTAMIHISPKSMLKGMTMKLNREQMYKYCRVAETRAADGGIVRAQGVLDKVGEFSEVFTAPIQATDSWSIGRMWNACQVEIQATKGYKIGSEENLAAAGKLLETVIRDTQPNYTAFERSAMMRSSNEIMKSFTMFSSDAMKQFSRMMESYGKLRTARRDAKTLKTDEAKARFKETQTEFARTFFAYLAANVMYVGMGFLIKHIFDKDKKEKDGKEVSFTEEFITELVGVYMGLFPVIRDMYSYFVDGYDVSSFDMNMLGDALESAKSVGNLMDKVVSGEEIDSSDYMTALKRLIFATGQITGVPTRNIHNQIVGLLKRFDSSAAYKYNDLYYDMGYTKDFQKALSDGDYELAETIQSARLKKLGLDNATVKNYVTLYGKGIDISTTIPSSFDIGEKTYEMEGHEAAYSKYAVKELSSALVDLVDETWYRNLDDEAKEDIQNKLKAYYRYLGKQAVMAEYKEDFSVNANEYIKNSASVGLDAALFLYYRSYLSAQTAYYTRFGGILRTKKQTIQWEMKKMGLTVAQQKYLLESLGYTA